MIVAMRCTRPTIQLQPMRRFYEELVGLPVLWSFIDHAGYDGVVFGVPDERAQLELVSTHHEITPRPSVEDVLVLYCEPGAAAATVSRLRDANVEAVPDDSDDLNPYWPAQGAVTFVDPDGYRLIVAVA
jgi:hypothetical protein